MLSGKLLTRNTKVYRVFGIHYFKMTYTTFQNQYPKVINHIQEIGKKNPEIKKSIDIC